MWQLFRVAVAVRHIAVDEFTQGLEHCSARAHRAHFFLDMKPFRRQHCANALATRGNLPLDRHLSNYFKDNHSIGSKDRAEIRA